MSRCYYRNLASPAIVSLTRSVALWYARALVVVIASQDLSGYLTLLSTPAHAHQACAVTRYNSQLEKRSARRSFELVQSAPFLSSIPNDVSDS